MGTFAPSDFLTPPEAAQLLRHSPRTLARMRAEGRGPKYHREGGLVLYWGNDLIDWFRQCTVTPPRSLA
ncbi:MULTISPECIES: helix-turn-helix domain-containing protein [Novosphingobium]|uniref:helix-turn-helix domain-containing protein n=1 Tax=Novosphingobium TaxID=165696 RepID=UPI0035164E17